jgi:hypothetical protein
MLVAKDKTMMGFVVTLSQEAAKRGIHNEQDQVDIPGSCSQQNQYGDEKCGTVQGIPRIEAINDGGAGDAGPRLMRL